MGKRYERAFNGEWIEPQRRGYRLACCDCGLVHWIDFRLVKHANGGKTIQFRAYRDPQATGGMRAAITKRKKAT